MITDPLESCASQDWLDWNKHVMITDFLYVEHDIVDPIISTCL